MILSSKCVSTYWVMITLLMYEMIYDINSVGLIVIESDDHLINYFLFV